MGGEPTFVSIDDMDGEEWNTGGARPEEARARRRAGPTAEEAFAPGGLLHCGQGKWYPGRIVAAMGARMLVAPRRRADLERRVPAGRRHRGLRPRRRRRQALHHGARRPAERRSAARAAGLRRRVVLPVARTAPAGQRRSAGVAADGRGRARASVARVRAGTRSGRRVRAAAASAVDVQPGLALGKRRAGSSDRSTCS